MTGLRAKLLFIGWLAASAAGTGAFAQSASDFRLRPGAATTPAAQGPVDPEASAPGAGPAAAPASPAPAPTATSSPPAPAPVIAVTPAPAPPPRIVPPTRPASAQIAAPAGAVRPVTGESAPSAAAGSPAAPSLAQPAPASPAPVAPAENLPVPADNPAAIQPDADTKSQPWWLLGTVLLAGMGGLAFFIRRQRGTAAAAQEAEWEPEAAADGDAPDPAPTFAPAGTESPAVAAAASAEPLAITLDPVRLSVSLVNATLHYQLTVSNVTAAPIGPVAVAADMIGAHASLSEKCQLAQDGTGLELRHELANLGPGEELRLTGELRVPLAGLTPIRAGDATLLVPLVRLRAETAGWSCTRAVVVGEVPLAPGGRLRPFRLDAGPRIFGQIDGREVAAAA